MVNLIDYIIQRNKDEEGKKDLDVYLNNVEQLMVPPDELEDFKVKMGTSVKVLAGEPDMYEIHFKNGITYKSRREDLA